MGDQAGPAFDIVAGADAVMATEDDAAAKEAMDILGVSIAVDGSLQPDAKGKGKEKKPKRVDFDPPGRPSDVEVIDQATKTVKLQEHLYRRQQRDAAKAELDQKRAQKAAERVVKTQAKQALPRVQTPEDEAMELLRLVRRYQRMKKELGCPGSGKTVNASSKIEDVRVEVMLQDQQANEQRSGPGLTLLVDAVVRVIENQIGKHVHPSVFDASDAHDKWRGRVEGDEAVQHILKHLEIKYSSWFAASPEAAFALCLSNHFKTINDLNQARAGAARSSQARQRKAPKKAAEMAKGL